MIRNIIKGERDSTWMVDSQDDTFVVAEKGSIRVRDGVGIDIEAQFTGNTIEIQGSVQALGGNGTAIDVGAMDTTVEVGLKANVSGNDGVTGSASGTLVRNQGNIRGASEGVAIGDDGRVLNHGHILGEFALELASGTVQNAKGAHITGHEVGILFTGETPETVINHGVISGGIAAIELGDFGGRIVNEGRIDGAISLGGDDSVLDTRHGIINGVIKGGDGSDTYIVSSASMDIVEGLFGGFDEVKSTVSIALPKNVESLELLGKRDINGRGTTGGDQLFGNAGDNHLTGDSGQDFLEGGAGNDLLDGGSGKDNFEFKKGGGTDTIADYHDGEDSIAVLEFSQFKNYGELSHHIHQHNDDVWITLGHDDKIIVKHADAAAFDPRDFFFELT